jgi:hypothetical protein
VHLRQVRLRPFVKELVERVTQAKGVEEVAPVLPLTDAQKRPRQYSAFEDALSCLNWNGAGDGGGGAGRVKWRCWWVVPVWE